MTAAAVLKSMMKGLSSDPETERRLDTRFRLSRQAVVWAGEQRYTCRTRDLARKGIGLISPIQYKPGSVLEVCFPFSGGKVWYKTDATLVWNSPRLGSYDWGLEFLEFEFLEKRSETELVEEVVSGEPQAWREFVETFSENLYSFIWHQCDGDQGLSSRLYLSLMHKLANSGALDNYLSYLSIHRGRLRLSTWLARQAQNHMDDCGYGRGCQS